MANASPRLALTWVNQSLERGSRHDSGNPPARRRERGLTFGYEIAVIGSEARSRGDWLSQAAPREISAGAHDGGVVDRPAFSEAVDTTLVHQLQHAQERDGDNKIIAQAGTLEGIVHGVVEATVVGLGSCPSGGMEFVALPGGADDPKGKRDCSYKAPGP